MIRLPVILAIACGLRLLWAVLVGVDPVSDPAIYDLYAQNIVRHGVFGLTPESPGAYWAVGAAAVYAGAYLIFGVGSLAVVAVNLLSSLLTVWGLWDLGRRWFGETEGRLAALLFAVWPMAVQFTTVHASELHFMAMTVLGLMAWDRAQRMTSVSFWLWVLGSGLAFAGATYLRPIALLVPALLALAVLLRSPLQSLGPIVKAFVITSVIFACVAPWSARNERIFDAPVFMSTNFWANFWMGNHPGTTGEYTALPAEVENLGDIARSQRLKEISLEQLRADPAGFVLRTAWKALKLHQRETIGIGWNEAAVRVAIGDKGVTLAKLVSTGWWYLILAAALWGAVTLARLGGIWAALLSPPVWLWGYFTGVHAVIVVGDRYHMPAIPMIALLAAVALARLRSRPEPEPDSFQSRSD